ncbi:type II secretion system protein N [Xanthomonas prunicola]|uniref:Type II secretion system protein N n=1 Tax=Xanthomonas prunicola TaxID=2053930 RepID=A0A9Q9J588_9XANT|nr:type II secretion system protein N [Xanthomonas prunicola]USJ02759.1 type II secretion system protein N [Xanthomonas prunicola]UXA51085.1 type II secretion system protein N [Xanthomonas prunicola]UXA55336.1 type II secretion system protein N [Xanthomonas prunicola]UXA59328.1 type II secretion system protein N [Xanthomonas prunicola]UXA63528.1 type II secretion system protein N [Xanthomonas prunicola]
MRWALILLLMLGVALIASLPLRLVLPREGLPFSVLDVEGSIWAGTLRQVQWQGIAFGDVAVRPRVWPLLRGQRQVHLQSTQLQLLLVDGAQHGIRNAQGQLLLHQPGGVALIDLVVQLQQVDLLFDATGCVQARGRVSLQLLASGTGDLPGLPPLQLSGQPQCMDDAAVLTLLPDAALPAGVQAEAQLQLWRDGRWQLQSRVDPAQDATLGIGLQLLGFTATPERGFLRNDQGRVR